MPNKKTEAAPTADPFQDPDWQSALKSVSQSSSACRFGSRDVSTPRREARQAATSASQLWGNPDSPHSIHSRSARKYLGHAKVASSSGASLLASAVAQSGVTLPNSKHLGDSPNIMPASSQSRASRLLSRYWPPQRGSPLARKTLLGATPPSARRGNLNNPGLIDHHSEGSRASLAHVMMRRPGGIPAGFYGTPDAERAPDSRPFAESPLHRSSRASLVRSMIDSAGGDDFLEPGTYNWGAQEDRGTWIREGEGLVGLPAQGIGAREKLGESQKGDRGKIRGESRGESQGKSRREGVQAHPVSLQESPEQAERQMRRAGGQEAARLTASLDSRPWSWSWAWTPPATPGVPDVDSPGGRARLARKFQDSSQAIRRASDAQTLRNPNTTALHKTMQPTSLRHSADAPMVRFRVSRSSVVSNGSRSAAWDSGFGAATVLRRVASPIAADFALRTTTSADITGDGKDAAAEDLGEMHCQPHEEGFEFGSPQQETALAEPDGLLDGRIAREGFCQQSLPQSPAAIAMSSAASPHHRVCGTPSFRDGIGPGPTPAHDVWGPQPASPNRSNASSNAFRVEDLSRAATLSGGRSARSAAASADCQAVQTAESADEETLRPVVYSGVHGAESISADCQAVRHPESEADALTRAATLSAWRSADIPAVTTDIQAARCAESAAATVDASGVPRGEHSAESAAAAPDGRAVRDAESADVDVCPAAMLKGGCNAESAADALNRHALPQIPSTPRLATLFGKQFSAGGLDPVQRLWSSCEKAASMRRAASSLQAAEEKAMDDRPVPRSLLASMHDAAEQEIRRPQHTGDDMGAQHRYAVVGEASEWDSCEEVLNSAQSSMTVPEDVRQLDEIVDQVQAEHSALICQLAESDREKASLRSQIATLESQLGSTASRQLPCSPSQPVNVREPSVSSPASSIGSCGKAVAKSHSRRSGRARSGDRENACGEGNQPPLDDSPGSHGRQVLHTRQKDPDSCGSAGDGDLSGPDQPGSEDFAASFSGKEAPVSKEDWARQRLWWRARVRAAEGETRRLRTELDALKADRDEQAQQPTQSGTKGDNQHPASSQQRESIGRELSVARSEQPGKVEETDALTQQLLAKDWLLSQLQEQLQESEEHNARLLAQEHARFQNAEHEFVCAMREAEQQLAESHLVEEHMAMQLQYMHEELVALREAHRQCQHKLQAFTATLTHGRVRMSDRKHDSEEQYSVEAECTDTMTV